MIYIGSKEENKEYEKRRAVFGIIYNDKNEIAIIDIDNFGFNLPGGKIEGNENSEEALIREVQEEIGYDIKNVKYLDTLGSYYLVNVRGKEIYCEAIADFYTAEISDKNNKKIEESHNLVWAVPNDIKDKLYFEYHRYVLENKI